ncbi:MAG: class I SAM-dependent RNA methyltransferase [Reyranellaceae bacterium]
MARRRGLADIEEPPRTREPACRHFGVCGGCALQHYPDDLYAQWKLDRLRTALDRAGVEPAALMPMARTPPGGRRRADLTLRHTGEGAIVGYAQRRSHDLVDLGECPVLLPAIVALLGPLRRLVAAILPENDEAEAVINWTDTGADLLLVTRLEMDLTRREAIAQLAASADVARVSCGSRGKPEIVLTRRAPKLRFGAVEIEPPPGAFLQASFAGEATLRAAVKAWSNGAQRIVDLYGGLGTLSLPLLPAARVMLVEGSQPAVDAANGALRKATLAGAAQAVMRDIRREPLSAEELEGFDLAILDPPMAGAASQARELALSRVPTLIYASCDPRSFAADARVLVAAGYRLERLLPVDQFLWSAHIELIALFRRIASG